MAALLVEQKVETAIEIAGRVAFNEHVPVRHEATHAALAADPEPLHRYVGVGR